MTSRFVYLFVRGKLTGDGGTRRPSKLTNARPGNKLKNRLSPQNSDDNEAANKQTRVLWSVHRGASGA